MSRQGVALGPPPADLAGFPRWRLRRTTTLYRAHRRDRDPWWFSTTMEGRFDLREPEGTCYLAFDQVTALREWLGQRLTALALLPAATVDQMVVSRLRVPREVRLADTCHADAAGYGVTRELVTLTPYELPQQWAAAFRAAGMAGVRYESRFSTAARPTAAAVFGPSGIAGWDTDPSPLAGRQVALEANVLAQETPRSSSLRILAPPG